MSQTEKTIIPFAPSDKGNDQLDKAGQSILNLLHKASGIAEENSRHALGMAGLGAASARTVGSCVWVVH